MPADDHGDELAARPGVRLAFSVNLNPLGMPASVREAIVAAVNEPPAYPDPHCTALRRALGEHHGVPAERIVCGNGASDLIYRICDVLLSPEAEPQAQRSRRVLIPAPTFSEYEHSARLCGAEVTRYPLDPSRDFDLDDGFLGALDRQIDLAFLCQPNNPTGRLIDHERLDRMIARAAEVDAIVVVDECFLPFTDAPSVIPKTADYENLIVLRAFTKTHALAGVRLGYAVFGSAELAAAVAGQGARWNVSSLAQAAGLAALKVPGWDKDTRDFVAQEREWVTGQLANLGLETVPSQANFVLFRGPADLNRRLAEHGIAIRHCANFAGLDETFWRIGLQKPPDNVALIGALWEALGD